MEAYFFPEGLESCGFDSRECIPTLFVPYNFIAREYKDRFTVETHPEPLSSCMLFLRRNRNARTRALEEGLILIVNLENKDLKFFRKFANSGDKRKMWAMSLILFKRTLDRYHKIFGGDS